MRILDLKMQAFGPFLKEQHISFRELNNKGMFLINGPTGSGKTSIFDAIVFALYGKGSGNDREDAKFLRSDFADDDLLTYVDLTFEANGQIYNVKRYPAYTKKNRNGGNTEVSSKAELTLPNNSSIISGTKNVDNYLEENVLFINRNQFKSVALLAQGEFTELINATSKDRAEILEHIFQKEIYDEFINKIEEKAKGVSQEKEQVVTSLNTLIDQIENAVDIVGYNEAKEEPSNIPNFLEHANEYKEKLSEILNSKIGLEESAKKEFLDAQNKLTSLRGQNAQIARYLEALKTVEKLENMRDLIEKKRLDNQKYDEFLLLKPLLQQRKKLNDNSLIFEGEIKSANDKLKEVETKETYLKENKEKYDSYINKIKALDSKLILLKEIDNDIKGLAVLNRRVSEADKIFANDYKAFKETETLFINTRDRFFASTSYNLAKDLKEGEVCPVCGSTHHPSLAKATDVVSEDEYKKAENKYNLEKDKISRESTRLEALKEQLVQEENKLIARLIELGFEADRDFIYSDAISKLIIEGAKEKEETQSFINSYESIKEIVIKDKNIYETKLNVAKTNRDNNLKELKKVEDDISSILENGKFIKCEEDYQEFINVASRDKEKREVKEFDDALLKNKTVIENTPKELTDLGLTNESELVEIFNQKQIAFNEANKEKNKIENEIKNLSKSIEQIHKKYLECKEIIDRYTSMWELSKVAKGNNKNRLSFKMYVLAEYFDKIINQANRRLMRITNGRYHLVRKTDVAKGSAQQGLDLDVYDVETGKTRAASSLSGGEKFVSALSLALGLSDIIETSHALIQVESIFIDEGFGSLDGNYLDMAMKALETLKDNKVVAIISHVEKLNEYISDGLEVRKTDIGSTIIFKNNY